MKFRVFKTVENHLGTRISDVGKCPKTEFLHATTSRPRQRYDMRKAIDGLVQLIEPVSKADPFCGPRFVILGKSGDNAKIIVWDGVDFWLPGARHRCRRAARAPEIRAAAHRRVPVAGQPAQASGSTSVMIVGQKLKGPARMQALF